MQSKLELLPTWIRSAKSTLNESSLLMVLLSVSVKDSWVTLKSGKCPKLYYRGQREIDLWCSYRHLNIGAGRIVWQDIVRIDVSIKKREFHKNKSILESFEKAKKGNGRVHLLGLVRLLPLIQYQTKQTDHRSSVRSLTEAYIPTSTTSLPYSKLPKKSAYPTPTSTSLAMDVIPLLVLPQDTLNSSSHS